MSPELIYVSWLYKYVLWFVEGWYVILYDIWIHLRILYPEFDFIEIENVTHVEVWEFHLEYILLGKKLSYKIVGPFPIFHIVDKGSLYHYFVRDILEYMTWCFFPSELLHSFKPHISSVEDVFAILLVDHEWACLEHHRILLDRGFKFLEVLLCDATGVFIPEGNVLYLYSGFHAKYVLM